MRRFAKPLSGVTCSEGSNPSLSAKRAPVAQWIERQVADLKAVGSSPAGRATFPACVSVLGLSRQCRSAADQPHELGDSGADAQRERLDAWLEPLALEGH